MIASRGFILICLICFFTYVSIFAGKRSVEEKEKLFKEIYNKDPFSPEIMKVFQKYDPLMKVMGGSFAEVNQEYAQIENVNNLKIAIESEDLVIFRFDNAYLVSTVSKLSNPLNTRLTLNYIGGFREMPKSNTPVIRWFIDSDLYNFELNKSSRLSSLLKWKVSKKNDINWEIIESKNQILVDKISYFLPLMNANTPPKMKQWILKMEAEPSRGLSEEQVDITLDFSPSDTTEREKTEYEKFQHLVTDLIVVQNRRSIFVSTVELCGEAPEHTAIDELTLNVGKMMDKFNDELTVLVDERLYKGIVDENIVEIIKSWMGKRENEMNQFRLMGKNRKFMSNIMNFLDSYKSTDMKVTEADLSGSVKVNAKSRTI